MKNLITQFSLVIIAFIALFFLMSYTRPAADEPKQYIILVGGPSAKQIEGLEYVVNQKLAEGWRLQGGISPIGQAMVK